MAVDRLTVCVRLNGIWRTFLGEIVSLVTSFRIPVRTPYSVSCSSTKIRVVRKLFLELALLASSKNDVVPNVAVYKFLATFSQLLLLRCPIMIIATRT